QFLVPENIVRHIVVTIDNLPRKKVAVELRPIKPTPGQTITATQGDITTLSVENYARYAPLVRLVQSTDVKTFATVYVRLYPLFQQAYEDLGYPGKYFNDRLVEAIDELLRTPEVPGPIALVQPKVFYEFPDPTLEAWAIQRRVFSLTHRRLLLAATSGRLIVITRRLLGGFDVADVRWQDLEEVALRVGVFGADLAIRAGKTTDLASEGAHGSRRLEFQGLRKEQAQAVYRICQAQDQAWREKRRIRELEELRARS